MWSQNGGHFWTHCYQQKGFTCDDQETISSIDFNCFLSIMPLPPKIDSELVIGLVGPVGSDIGRVRDSLTDFLQAMNYMVVNIKVSRDILTRIAPNLNIEIKENNEFERATSFMDVGNTARKTSDRNDILSLGVVSKIYALRDEPDKMPKERTVYIVDSLKHPDEVSTLREVYGKGFYLIGLHGYEDQRQHFLTSRKSLSDEVAKNLMERDYDEELQHGQRTRDTFHLSDFFLQESGDRDTQDDNLKRFVNLLFGFPYSTPTLDEYAMFLAFSSSLRSADLSRQVGAVIVSQEGEIIATGTNDVPKFGGGLCWPEHDEQRDWHKGFDSNEKEKQEKVQEILDAVNFGEEHNLELRKILIGSSIMDITEYGRPVHAEMEALMSCVRSGVSARNSTLYCTTFPCHNCAKHIVDAGISRVVYVEPYPKSKAGELYSDSVEIGLGTEGEKKVSFEPFFGVGPRRFFDLFSMNLGDGRPLKRKENGDRIEWIPGEQELRVQLSPNSYLDEEKAAASDFLGWTKKGGV